MELELVLKELELDPASQIGQLLEEPEHRKTRTEQDNRTKKTKDYVGETMTIQHRDKACYTILKRDDEKQKAASIFVIILYHSFMNDFCIPTAG